MKEYDVVVAGAGPAGSMAALHAARGGLSVLLLEKRAEIGAPKRCAEGVSLRRLREVGIEPDRKWISSEIIGTTMRSPGGAVLKVDESSEDGEVGYVLDRHLFDKHIAKLAAEAGAEVRTRAACRAVATEDGRPVSVTVRGIDGEEEIGLGCLVAADGFESQVARWAGVDTSLRAEDIDICCQYLMSGVDIEPGYCEFLLGSGTPGGYAWIFPKGPGIANVGLGIQASLSSKERCARYYLDRFVASEPRLSKGSILEISGGAVSTCPGFGPTVYDGLVLVGDAARIINPLTGGGIYHALMTGMHAGRVIAGSGKAGGYTAESMAEYERLWKERIQDELDTNWKAKERYVRMDDAEIDRFIAKAAGFGLKKVRPEELIKVARAQ